MNDVTFTSHDYPIGGKMVVGSYMVSELDAIDMMNNVVGGKEEIKKRLLMEMLEYMLENKLVEFTMVEDHARATRTFRVRAYLAPNDQVKILRTAYKID
jgi:hypothetical protein